MTLNLSQSIILIHLFSGFFRSFCFVMCSMFVAVHFSRLICCYACAMDRRARDLFVFSVSSMKFKGLIESSRSHTMHIINACNAHTTCATRWRWRAAEQRVRLIK